MAKMNCYEGILYGIGKHVVGIIKPDFFPLCMEDTFDRFGINQTTFFSF
jgi:hypothetical protein